MMKRRRTSDSNNQEGRSGEEKARKKEKLDKQQEEECSARLRGTGVTLNEHGHRDKLLENSELVSVTMDG